MVDRFGPELGILGDVPLDDLAAGAPSIVAEAIARLRRGEVRREAGYDGVYGTIRLFDPDELAGAALFDVPTSPPASKAQGRTAAGGTPRAAVPSAAARGRRSAAPAGLDPEQHAIVTHDGGPLLVVAGPGAGKTRVLTHAIAHRIGAGLAARALPGRHVHPPRPRRAPRPARRAARRGRRRAGHGRHLPRSGLLILREQCKLLGLDADLKVADEKTRQEVLRSLSAGERPAALGARIAESKR